ncbi:MULTISPECIES: 3-phosphoshikimate 1-carboxyvinyltransferase [unclassified Solwaraspora]|uniref:3-phosphoshikimate 1-carboxyvinyltransferase n=1 Tax=unclassified Solwaraspora TaxID=2627926 RepID=UPI00259BC2E1|nr:3-phosphoshikimate 1-carboxyvinyltransferase [Solwaraspora sp. WMMA2056]WJK40412.1 3-phosphoshikimate 1-carboxyvinyltransferase [Solwaraspora sp. WMMA2056]
MPELTTPPPPRPWSAPTAAGGVRTALRLPGSKSMTARALVLGAVAAGPGTVTRPLRARDTTLMSAALGALGVDLDTSSAQRWTVRPGPLRGSTQIDVGLAGTIMRFLPAVAALADGPVTFDGDPHARTRPLGPLLAGLRALGVDIDAADGDLLPITVHGTGQVPGGAVTVDATRSSQFVSGLLLAAPRFTDGVTVRHVGAALPSTPHVRMTVEMLRAAGAVVDDSVADTWRVEPGELAGRDCVVEPDLSGAMPFFAAALVTGGTVTLVGWPTHSVQPIRQLTDLVEQLGGTVTVGPAGLTVTGTGTIHGLTADLREVGELTPVLAALAALADSPSRLTGVAHIRGHETDRLAALAAELTGLGAQVTELPDGLEIDPKPLRGGTWRTYDDHRMAHAAAVLGLVVPDVELTDVGCTSKTLPEFPTLWSAVAAGDPGELADS